MADVEISYGNGDRWIVNMAASMRKMVGLLKAYGVAVTEDVSLTFRNVSGDEGHGKQTGGDCPGPVINEDCGFKGDGDEAANSDDADNDNADNDDADNDEDNDKPAEKSQTSTYAQHRLDQSPSCVFSSDF